jgi:hypothetical protein
MRAQYANNHTPRFYVKMGKEIIWDFPIVTHHRALYNGYSF